MTQHYLEADEEDEVFVEINTTPLIDVLLVLLIMIIVTVPMQTHLLDMTLPKESAQSAPPPPAIKLTIDDAGDVRWDGSFVVSRDELETRLGEIARASDPPELHLKASGQANYGKVAEVMAAIQRHGISKFGLVDIEGPSTYLGR